MERPPIVLMPYAGMMPLSHAKEVVFPDSKLVLKDVGEFAHSYWELLRKYWSYPGVLLIVEQHMVVTPAHLEELVSCDHILCSQAYKRSGDFYWCHNTSPLPFSDTQARWLEPSIPYAGFSGLGCCKLTYAARRGKWLPCTRWQVLDQAVSKALCSQWHIHWPGVEHNHPLPGSPPSGAGPEWFTSKIEERALVIGGTRSGKSTIRPPHRTKMYNPLTRKWVDGYL